ncbi:MAG: acetyl-CoA synthetase, partial [Cytophagales bacterium]|nr:acetyl-CoA synthetase [Cytophaga sp.]
FIIPPSIGLSQRFLNKSHTEEYYLNVPEPEGLPALRKHGDGFSFILSEEGIPFYKSMGRTDDSMNLGGIKVCAVELEYVFNQHPEVAESAAIAVQDKDGGPEKLVVFIQPAGKVMDMAALQIELQKQIQQQLNPLFKISAMILKEAFPRTASNKLMRKDLRKEYKG